MEQTKVGTLIEAGAQRDAIHIAVAPSVAGQRLYPGQHVVLSSPGDDLETMIGAAPGQETIGIVDPFLTHPVSKGERFWTFLHPQTITSLRHNWPHPAFEPTGKVSKPADAATPKAGKTFSKSKASSKAWLTAFGSVHGLSYDDLIDAASKWLNRGDYLIDGGKYEGQSVPDEFWDHYDNVQGIKTDPADRQSFFSCSC